MKQKLKRSKNATIDFTHWQFIDSDYVIRQLTPRLKALAKVALAEAFSEKVASRIEREKELSLIRTINKILNKVISNFFTLEGGVEAETEIKWDADKKRSIVRSYIEIADFQAVYQSHLPLRAHLIAAVEFMSEADRKEFADELRALAKKVSP